MTPWRYILDGPASGAWNMAADEALQRCYRAGGQIPVLRFYQWNPACVSLGRFQRASSLFVAAGAGFDLVRRPTGGRAVLHQHELTYAVVIGRELLPAPAQSVMGAYAWLSQGFVEGLRVLGIEATLAPADPRVTEAGPNCFTAAARCDFLVRGRKLIGAAQCRNEGVILQHGSVLMDIDAAAWEGATGGEMTGATALRELGAHTDFARLAAILRGGMEQALGITTCSSALTAAEEALASQLHHQKYTADAWTHGELQALEPAGKALDQAGKALDQAGKAFEQAGEASHLAALF